MGASLQPRRHGASRLALSEIKKYPSDPSMLRFFKFRIYKKGLNIKVMKIFNMKCPNCGGSLEVGEDTTQFTCGYCGSEQFVERKGGMIQLRLLEDSVVKIESNTNRMANELALERLKKELEVLSQNKIQEFTDTKELLLREDDLNLVKHLAMIEKVKYLLAAASLFLGFVIGSGEIFPMILFGLVFYAISTVIYYSIKKPFCSVEALSKSDFEKIVDSRRKKKYDNEIDLISRKINEIRIILE